MTQRRREYMKWAKCCFVCDALWQIVCTTNPWFSLCELCVGALCPLWQKGLRMEVGIGFRSPFQRS